MTDLSPILICGTGALACLFASRLADVGVPITMLGTWPEGLGALRKNGVHLLGDDDKETAYSVQVADDPTKCLGIENALVLVKAWQTERIGEQLSRCLGDQGVALTLQNGWGNREILANYLGVSSVALGVTTTGATLVGPGRVRPGGEGVISLGSHPRLNPMVVLLQNAGFMVEITTNVDSLIWGKLVINAAINPLTAILKVPNGDLLSRPSARLLMAEAASEVAEVASMQGISLGFPDPIMAAENVAMRTATNHSSMFQDIKRGAPTEIEAICGAIVRIGEEINVPTPINSVLYKLVKGLTEN